MRTLYAVCLVLILAWPLESAPPEVEPTISVVQEDHPITTDGARLPVVEPHLAVDPSDASHLVAAAIIVKKSDPSGSDCAVFVSFDGGVAWRRHELSLLECGDPWVAIGVDGTILLTVLGRATAQEDRPYSSDRGERWTKPIRVNQGSGTSPYVRTPSLAVNRHGVVGIAWYDARNARDRYKREFVCQEIYFAASLDGGNTFLPEVKVSSEKSCPMSPENGEAGWRWPAGGDYMGLAADTEGAFVLVWADSRRGTYQLHTATLKVNAPGKGWGTVHYKR